MRGRGRARVRVAGAGRLDSRFVALRRADADPPRANGAAATLSDGRVLIVGGVDSDDLVTGTGELYSANSNSWTVIAPMPVTLDFPLRRPAPRGPRARRRDVSS